jgi:hypothetical protein
MCGCDRVFPDGSTSSWTSYFVVISFFLCAWVCALFSGFHRYARGQMVSLPPPPYAPRRTTRVGPVEHRSASSSGESYSAPACRSAPLSLPSRPAAAAVIKDCGNILSRAFAITYNRVRYLLSTIMFPVCAIRNRLVHGPPCNEEYNK